MRKSNLFFVAVGVVLTMGMMVPAEAQFGTYGAPELLSTFQPGAPPISQAGPVGTRLAPVRPAAYPYGTPTPSANPSRMLPPITPYAAASMDHASLEPLPAGEQMNRSSQYGNGNFYEGSCSDSCCETSCGECCETPCCCTPPPWYAYAGGVFMGRDKSNRVWTTYESGNNPNQLMNTGDIEMSWHGGGEFLLGRSFCCGAFAIEASYWWLPRMTSECSMTHANGVSTPLNLSNLVVGPGQDPMEDLFDIATEHRLERDNEMHNVEVNFIFGGSGLYGGNGYACGGYRGFDCAGWQPRFLAGVRYFRFEEDLLFGSLAAGGSSWGPSEGNLQGYLSDEMTNSMVGAQLGFLLTSPEYYNLRLLTAIKFGIYNNHIENYFDLYRGDGFHAYTSATSDYDTSYPVRSSSNYLSTISEINLGVQWRFSPRWSAVFGYRVMAITGIGLADNQIPHYVIDTPEIASIDNNGEMILHGAFAGLTFTF